MAGTNEVKTKLVLDGEKEYKAALNDAYRQLRILRSELKAESAELGKNATEQQKNAAKAKNLKASITEQKKIVETLTKALEQSKKQYPGNVAAQEQWILKLNNARAALATMQDALKNATEGMEDLNDAADGFNDKLGDGVKNTASAVVNLNDSFKSITNVVSSVASAVGNSLDAISNTVKEVASEVYNLMNGAFDAASKWKSVQKTYGGSTESIEGYYRGIMGLGYDVSTADDLYKTLNTQIHTDNGEALLKSWGLAEGQFENHWDLMTAVMNQIAGQGTNKDLMETLFGGEYTKFSSLVNDWGQVNASDYITQSSSETDYLSDTEKRISQLAEYFDSFKDYLGKELAIRLDFQGLTDDTLDILKTLYNIVSSDNIENAETFTSQLTENVETLVTDLTNGITNVGDWLDQIATAFQTSDNSTVQTIGKALSGVARLLEWVSNNADAIISLLEGWLKSKLANAAVEAATGMDIGENVNNVINTVGESVSAVIGLKGLQLLKGNGAGAGGASTGGGGLSSLWNSITSGVSNFTSSIGAAIEGSALAPYISSFLGTPVAAAAPYVAGAYALLKPGTAGGDIYEDYAYAFNDNQLTQDLISEVDALVAELGEDEVRNRISAQEAANQDAAERSALYGDMPQALEDWWDEYKTSGVLDNTYLDKLYSISGDDALGDLLSDAVQGLDLSSADLPEAFWTNMGDYFSQYGINTSNVDNSDSNAAKMRTAVTAAVKDGMRGVTLSIDGNTLIDYINHNLGADFVLLQ